MAALFEAKEPPAKQHRERPVVPTGPPVVVTLDLAAVPTAVSCSRIFVRHALTQWGMKALQDTAELVISELVTNAVEAVGITEGGPSWAELAEVQLVQVRVLVLPGRICLQVWDASQEAPQPTTAEPIDEAESGRGLFIVGTLSARNGHFLLRSGGKVVWAELVLETGAQPLRQRTAVRRTAIRLPNADPDLLRRELARLKRL
jgi:anti-sigma regulatory factor (Ser/Thr protein kinase)